MNSDVRLGVFLDGLVAEGICPGAVAIVCDRDGILFSHVSGVRQLVPELRPLSFETQFDLASVSKVVSTTMVAARLRDFGVLSYEDTVGRFLPYSGKYGDVTLRQLLTHTGGFVSELRLWNYVSEPSDVLRYILDLKPEYRPGTRYEYSCFGFIVLGAILEYLYGKRLDLAAAELVFSPLGMSQTCYNPLSTEWQSVFPNIAATEYDDRSGHILVGEVHDENARFLGGVAGNAGVFSTAGDISLFLRMLLCDGRTSGGMFLSSERIHEFHTDYTHQYLVGRGIGFMLATHGDTPAGTVVSCDSYGHTGFTGTSIWIDPTSGLAACLLTNRVHPSRIERRLIGLRPFFHDLAFSLSK